MAREWGRAYNLGKMGCSPIPSLIRRAGQPGETKEEVVQDENHSDHILHVLGNEEETSEKAPYTEDEGEQEMQQDTNNTQNTDIESRRKKIKWPNSNAKGKWEQFDMDAAGVLNSTLAGSVDRKIEAMTKIIYNMGMDRFGVEEGKKPRIDGRKNRREREIVKMRRDLRQLSKQYKKATEVEKTEFSDLRNNIREQLKVVRRAERSRRRRKERDRARSRFISDPFQFTAKGQEC